jgi:hypothetical protein
MEDTRWIIIFFTDGTNLKFGFPRQLDDTSQIGTMLKKALNEKQLVLEVDDIMFTIPFVNVKYIQVYPCPEKLPDTAIRGATLME